MRRQKSYYAKEREVKKSWVLIDAEDKILGRLASKVAHILRGKHKAIFTPSVDTGDFVIIINSEKIKVTGNKQEQKKYYNHSGYPGGLKEVNYKTLQKKFPERILYRAIRGMLPHNSLGRKVLKNVKIYAGSEHPHEAQNPEKVEV